MAKPKCVAKSKALEIDDTSATVKWTLNEDDYLHVGRPDYLQTKHFKVLFAAGSFSLAFYPRGWAGCPDGACAVCLSRCGREAAALRFEVKVGEERRACHDFFRAHRTDWVWYDSFNAPRGGAAVLSLTVFSAHTAADLSTIKQALLDMPPDQRAAAQKDLDFLTKEDSVAEELVAMTERAEEAEAAVAKRDEELSAKEQELADLRALLAGSPDRARECQEALREELMAVLGAVHETDKLLEAMAWFKEMGADSLQDLVKWSSPGDFADALSLKKIRKSKLVEEIYNYVRKKNSGEDATSGAGTASDSGGKKLDDYKKSLQDQINSNRFELWFLDATMLRRWDRSKDGPLRSQQELKEMPGWLMMRSISLRDLLHGKYDKRYIVASHRWVGPDHPDKSCEKMEQLRDWLRQEANRSIEGVWLDFGCLPQGVRTKKEEAMFHASFQVMNLLYLGLHVLIFFDLQYVGRFWCLYETFLATHGACAAGICMADDDSRYTLLCLGASKKDGIAKEFRESWKKKTVEEALLLLREDDIEVTNKKDKDIQLSKLATIHDDVKALFNLAGEA